MIRRSALSRLLPGGVILVVIVAFYSFEFDRYLTVENLRENEGFLRTYVSDNPIAASLIFTMLYVSVVAFSVPSATVMTISGGFIFGLWHGASLSATAATIGSIALYLIARFSAGDVLRARGGPFIARMARGFDQAACSYLLFLRLIPLFPFWAVNLAGALLGVPLRIFAFATLIGIVPGTLAYTAIGDGLRLAVGNADDLISPANIGLRVGLAALALVPIAVKLIRRRRGQ